MSFRRAALATLVGVALVAGPVPAYGHDDGKGHVSFPGQEVKQQEFEGVTARNAASHSNAPESFAPCVDGLAAGTYPCDGVDMLSHLWLDDLGLSFANDIWGWTDPLTAKDYALVGGTEGTVFVDISDAKRPRVVGMLPTHSTEGGDFWRDIKVYGDHAFVVSENKGHGLQVFDLTRLRDAGVTPATFTADVDYQEFGSAHNININTGSGYAYAVGTTTCDGGLHMVDVRDPKNPTFAGCMSDVGYVHDTQCVDYQGPDTEHVGREVCVSSAAQWGGASPEQIVNTVAVVDVTDKSNPRVLSNVEYPGDGYSHQGWLTPDQATFLHGDELDEVFNGNTTRTRVWDVSDLDNPSVTGAFDNTTTSIDHNMYTQGQNAYQSNYTSGLRVLDTSEAAQGMLTEKAFFDTYPENDNASFEGGTWSNYPYFRQQGIVAVNTMDRGLFVLKPRIGAGG
ncbi:MAG TPA: choice-of-anchor B family protein [Actinomycetes bacterium]|nr:choice-of-anchor B family protein [Actinomycetes bacterium]